MPATEDKGENRMEALNTESLAPFAVVVRISVFQNAQEAYSEESSAQGCHRLFLSSLYGFF